MRKFLVRVVFVIALTHGTALLAASPQAAKPKLSPASGTYASAVAVSMTDQSTSAIIYYTTDGTPPTTASTLYTAPIKVPVSANIQAIAVAAGHLQSAVASAAYTIETPTAAPMFSATTGTYLAPISLTISDETPGAVIYYTTNGTTPVTASMKYSGPIQVDSTETVKALALAPGYVKSTVVSGTFTYQAPAAKPVLTPAPGTFTATQQITLTDATAGSSLHYTLDGSTPTATSPIYTSPITIKANTTINVYASAGGHSHSPIVTGIYTLNLPTTATPVLTPAGGTYSRAQSVSITDATPKAVIYYTTDGSTPTPQSAKYTYPLSVWGSETLNVIAVAPGDAPSPIASAMYSLPAFQGVVPYAGNGTCYSGGRSDNCTGADSGIGGPALDAELGFPLGVATDSAGNVYIADEANSQVLEVDSVTGIITVFAGTGMSGVPGAYSGDGGPAINAELSGPTAITFDVAGNMFIADSGDGAIRRIDAQSGIITTVAGGIPACVYPPGQTVNCPNGDGGLAIDAHIYSSYGIAVNSIGDIYISEWGYSDVRKVSSATHKISTIVGAHGPGYSGDYGPANQAQVNQPYGLAFDGDDNLYITDSANSRIRKIAAGTGTITTVVGIGGFGFSGDGEPATRAQLDGVFAPVAFDSSGNLYLADAGNRCIREVFASTGVIDTVFGDRNFPPILSAPGGLSFDGAGNLFIADTVNQVIREVPLLSSSDESSAAHAAKLPHKSRP